MEFKVGINGFGRVGKGLFKVNYEEKDPGKRYDVDVVKDIIPIDQLAYLLQHDSTYGKFQGTIEVDGTRLVVDGKRIQYFQEENMIRVPWNDFGITYLIQSAGSLPIETAREIAGDNRTVIYTRNMDEADKTIVMGVNQEEYDSSKHRVLSSSTCTGNAIVPIVKVINDAYGIERGHLTTIHPVLADQKLLDVAHEKPSLGRTASSSIIPTSTNIAKSLEKILAPLAGKFTAHSFRVPTTIVSAIEATFSLSEETTREKVNNLFREYAASRGNGVVLYDSGFMGHSKVSIDFIRCPCSAVFLSSETQVSGNILSISLFHDNEWGYCSRVHNLINYIQGRKKGN